MPECRADVRTATLEFLLAEIFTPLLCGMPFRQKELPISVSEIMQFIFADKAHKNFTYFAVFCGNAEELKRNHGAARCYRTIFANLAHVL